MCCFVKSLFNVVFVRYDIWLDVLGACDIGICLCYSAEQGPATITVNWSTETVQTRSDLGIHQHGTFL